jgi:hypothetical protein
VGVHRESWLVLRNAHDQHGLIGIDGK